MGIRLPEWIMSLTCSVFTSVAVGYLQDTVSTMIPWIMAMCGVVLADLIAGLRKSLKLGVHVSWSMAFRNTMGKMVTYVAFVLMVAMIDTASGHEFRIAMWGCLFVCGIEGGSIISNLMKPYGIDITPKTIFAYVGKVFSQKVVKMDSGDLVCEEKDMDALKKREKDRWEKRKAPSDSPNRGSEEHTRKRTQNG